MQDKKYDVIHIGEANHDFTFPDVPEDFYTGDGETYVCGVVRDGAGGDAANQALCVASLGDRNALFGRMETGVSGMRLTQILRDRGVDTSMIIRDDDCVNPKIMVGVRKDGSHRFLCGRGRNYGLRKDDIVPGTLDMTKALAIGSLFVLDTLDLDGGLVMALELCRSAGVVVFADMTYDIRGLGPRIYDDIYPMIDFLLPSWDEAYYVTGLDHEEAMADFFLGKGVKNVAVKLGRNGSFFKNANERFYTDPYVVDPVDTTGCGDNFTAGFIHAWLKGQTMRECMQFASATGALNSLGMGASSYVRSEQMVLDFMREAEIRHIDR